MARGITPKKLQMAERQAQVAELYLTGKTQMEIAAELEVDQATVSRDLRDLQTAWAKTSLRKLDRAKGEELRKIDRLEREYWDAWKRSVGTKTETSKKKVARPGRKGKDGEPPSQDEILRAEAQERTSDLMGDPRFLQGVQWCIERRCKLLGIDAAGKHSILNLDLSKLTDEQLARIAAGEEPIHVLATTGGGGTGAETPFPD